jgi:hypothetical protein
MNDTGAPPQTVVPVATRRASSPWLYLVVAMILMAASGAVRIAQDRRLEAATAQANHAPFPLVQLPHQFGDWKARGEDQTFDPKTLQIVGCSDYVVRTYVDERTGVALTALIAYGPAERIVGHTPAVCYPAVGYRLEAGPTDHSVKADGKTAVVRSYIFDKADDRVDVYVGFQHDGRWSPDAAATRKMFRHKPGMVKIQVQRQLGRGERADQDDPIQEFLPLLIAELEKSMAATK